MEGKCSFSDLAKSSCGDFRGSTRMVCRLRECQEGITGHLQACHLSKLTGIPEYELILPRAGLFDVPLHRQEEMFVCPKHRYNLGRNWRPLRTCQYPLHSGSRKKLRNRNVVNMQMYRIYNQFLEQQFLLGQVSGLYTFILLCVVIATKLPKLLINKTKIPIFGKRFASTVTLLMKLLI